MITPSTDNNVKIRFNQSPNQARLELGLGLTIGTLGFVLLYVAWNSGILRVLEVLVVFVGGTFYSVSAIRRFPVGIQDEIARRQRSYFLLLLAAAVIKAYNQIIKNLRR